MGFFNPEYSLEGKEVCTDCYKEVTAQKEEQRRLKQEQRNQAISKIILSTGNLNVPYEIVDTVITVSAHQAGYFDAANPSTAFDGVKTSLRTLAYDMGADAVICCEFDYRVGAERGLLGSQQFVEIFAYGTAVKLKEME